MKTLFARIFKSNQNVALIIASYLAIVFIASQVNFKIDLTSGGLYTLSEGSKQLIDGIDEKVTIKYFFSSSNRTLPIQVKNYGKRVRELLEEFANESNNLSLEVYDPKPDSDEEEMATRYGINGVKVNDGESFYMGAALLYLDEVHQLPFFDPRREKFLEYEIASLLAKVGEKEKKTIGLLAGFEIEQSPMPFMNQQLQNSQDNWMFRKELEGLYNVRILDKDIKEIPEDVDLLLVAHPVDFSNDLQYAIDQYIVSGGKTVLVVDPSPYTVSEGKSSDLNKVFRTLDLNYQPHLVAVDEENAAVVNTQRGRMRLPVWLSFNNKGFSKKSIATSQLQTGLFVEPGFFELKSSSKNTYESLLNTSEKGGSVDASRARSLADRPDSYQKKNKALSLAGVVKGKFKSAYDKKPEGSTYSKTHIKEAESENSVMVVGDIDFLNNQFALNAFNFFGRPIIQPKNHNIAFLTNSIEFMAGRPELISVRSRGTFSRPFTTVQELEKAAQAKWLGVEQELSKKIQDLQSKLNELQQAKTDDNQVILSQQQKSEIQNFKLEQAAAKKKRREVRKHLRQEIESLGGVLSGVNIGLMPLLVLSFGLYIFNRRNKGLPVFKKEHDHV